MWTTSTWILCSVVSRLRMSNRLGTELDKFSYNTPKPRNMQCRKGQTIKAYILAGMISHSEEPWISQISSNRCLKVRSLRAKLSRIMNLNRISMLIFSVRRENSKKKQELTWLLKKWKIVKSMDPNIDIKTRRARSKCFAAFSKLKVIKSISTLKKLRQLNIGRKMRFWRRARTHNSKLHHTVLNALSIWMLIMWMIQMKFWLSMISIRKLETHLSFIWLLVSMRKQVILGATDAKKPKDKFL